LSTHAHNCLEHFPHLMRHRLARDSCKNNKQKNIEHYLKRFLEIFIAINKIIFLDMFLKYKVIYLKNLTLN